MTFLTNGLATHLPASERKEAARQLGDIGPTAKAAVPVLVQALEGTDLLLVDEIVIALKKIGEDPETYLPRLKMLLQANDEHSRVNAAARVLDVAPADHEAHLVLMKMIKSRSVYQRFAADTLGEAGPAAAEAIPVLREAAENSSQQSVKDAARRALKRIKAKPAVTN